MNHSTPREFYYKTLNKKGKYILINSLTCEDKRNTRAKMVVGSQLSDGVRSGTIGNWGIKTNGGRYALKKIDISDTQAYADVVMLMLSEGLIQRAGEPCNPYVLNYPIPTYTNTCISYVFGLIDVVNSEGTKHNFEIAPIVDSTGFHGCAFRDPNNTISIESLPKETENNYTDRVLRYLKKTYFNTPLSTKNKVLAPFARELCTVLGEDSGFTDRAKLYLCSTEEKRQIILKVYELRAGINRGTDVLDLEHKSISNMIALALFAIYANKGMDRYKLPRLTVNKTGGTFRDAVTNLTLNVDWGHGHIGILAISYMHRTPDGTPELSVMAIKGVKYSEEKVIKSLPTPRDHNANKISATCLYRTLVELIPKTH